MGEVVRTFRLGSSAGLSADADGVFLAGVPLLAKGVFGFAPRPTTELKALFLAAYGPSLNVSALTKGLSAASRELNRGDLAGAMIAAVHLRLPELPDAAIERLGVASMALAKYDPNEPRDWHGRWTDGSGGGDQGPTTGGRAVSASKPVNVAPPAPRSPEDWGGSHPSGGRLIQVQVEGGGSEDEGGEDEPEPEPDERPENERPPREWERPDGRFPVLRDGSPWPVATPAAVRRTLAEPFYPRMPARMVIFVPFDGKGPLLIGADNESEYELPNGYDRVTLSGTPQVTRSGGAETRHADDSVETALAYARTNQFSDIGFNRSFATMTNGQVAVQLRPDVIGIVRQR